MNTVFICPTCHTIPFIEAISIDSQEEYIYKTNCQCGRKDIPLLSLAKRVKEVTHKTSFCYNTRHKTQKESSFYCGVCSKWYCKKCSIVHHDDLHHNFFPCEVNTTLFCYKHPKEEAHYLCNTCQMILCKTCACEAIHKTHQSNSIRDNKKSIQKEELEEEKDTWEGTIKESTSCRDNSIKVIDEIISKMQEYKKSIIEKYNKFIEVYKAQSILSQNIKNNTYLLPTNYINANNYSKIGKIQINNLSGYIEVKQLSNIKEEIESKISSLANLNPLSLDGDKREDSSSLSATELNVTKKKFLLNTSNSSDSKRESQFANSIDNNHYLDQYRSDPF